MMLSILILLVLIGLVIGSQKATKKDPNDNKGNTPFFLQDPYDHQCLGSVGFGDCNEKALWMLTKRKGLKTYSLVSLMQPTEKIGGCLQRKKEVAWWLGPLSFIFRTGDSVGVGSCSTSMSKAWQFEFIDNTHVKLSTKQGNRCLVRGGHKDVDKRFRFKSQVGMQSCSKGSYLPLVYHPTTIHDVGFYLKSIDGKLILLRAARHREARLLLVQDHRNVSRA